MRLVYIVGPYRAATAWEVEQNIRRAEEVGLEIARMGAMPVVPHTLTRFYGGECPEDFWLLGTFMLMRAVRHRRAHANVAIVERSGVREG